MQNDRITTALITLASIAGALIVVLEIVRSL